MILTKEEWHRKVNRAHELLAVYREYMGIMESLSDHAKAVSQKYEDDITSELRSIGSEFSPAYYEALDCRYLGRTPKEAAMLILEVQNDEWNDKRKRSFGGKPYHERRYLMPLHPDNIKPTSVGQILLGFDVDPEIAEKYHSIH